MVPVASGTERPPPSDPELKTGEIHDGENASAVHAGGPAADEPRPEPDRLRLLIVDDYRDAAESLGRLLGAWGHDVRVCRNGPEALEAVSSYRPDAALVDIVLPGMDGFALAQRLRAQPELLRMTLIAVTGLGDKESRRSAQDAGFAHHLLKPIAYTELQEILGTVRKNRNPSTR